MGGIDRLDGDMIGRAEPAQRREHGGGIGTGQHPAIDRRLGELRQRVVGMAAGEAGGDAAGAGEADLGLRSFDDVRRRAVILIGEPAVDRRRELGARGVGAVAEISAGGVVEMRLEAEMLEPVERGAST